ncbi:MAG: ATP-binding protein [Sneathiella sp.]
MEIPAIPEYEDQRLEALRKLRILDTSPEENFDRITRLVYSFFGVSVVQVNLVDRDRVWAKSSHGITIDARSREKSFCAHTINSDDILCVPDAREDPRFTDNSVMPDGSAARFYAGIPLSVYGGFKIGTLCIFDANPREFTSSDYNAMKDFARNVEQQFNLSRLEEDGRFLISQTSRLNILLETVADGIVTVDSSGVIESLNTAAAHIFGYDPGDLIGGSISRLVPAILDAGWASYVKLIKSSDGLYNSNSETDQLGRHNDGSLFPMDLQFREMHLEGKLLYTGIVRDITEAKAVQDEIRLGREILEATKENIPVGLSVFDKNLRLKVTNSQTPEFLELPPELFAIGTHFQDIMSILVKRGDFGDWNETKQKSELEKIIALPISRRFAKVDNGARYVEIFSANMPGGGFVSTYMDITDRLKNEEKLESLLQQANNANEAKTNFLSTVSHEIRTPLNGVIGVAQLLEDTELDRDQRQKLETILHSGNTLLELINDVLDMSKIESGNLEIEYIICDVGDLIQSIMKPFELEAGNRGLKIHTNIDPEMDQFVIADPTRLRQIILNLISNAMKFTEKGSVTVSVSAGVSKQETKKKMMICVEDTGVGIAEDRQNAIFKSFSQADNSVSRKFGGTGLGLSIVKKLVALMDGEINLYSKPGEGTRFDVSFEFDRATEEQILAQEIQLEVFETLDVGSLDILVAEDNHVNALVTSSFLEKLGHRCEVVENGQLAVQALDFARFDMVLMDVHMPVLDGIEATRKIRQNFPMDTLPIVGVTAEAFTDRHKYMREIGMTDILTKPFTKDQLQRVINQNTVFKGETLTMDQDQEVDTLERSESSLMSTHQLAVGSDVNMKEFIDQLGQEVALTIISKTPDSIRAEIKTLHEGLAAEDTSVVGRAVHTIAGVAGSMCAERLAKQASLMEQMAEDLDEIKSVIPEFEQTVEDSILWWNQVLEDITVGA